MIKFCAPFKLNAPLVLEGKHTQTGEYNEGIKSK